MKKTEDKQRTVNDRQMFGCLREIRAAAQDIQGSVIEMRKRALALEPAKRAAFLIGVFTNSYLGRIDQIISAKLAGIQQLFDTDKEEYEWAADNITTIRLTWARVKEMWPAPDATFEVIDQRLADINAALDQIVYQCATLSLSPRVNDVLENLRTGQALDFDFEFVSELPLDVDLRNRLFLELAQQGGVLVSGVVDTDDRVIYKAAASRGKQQLSAVRLALCLIVGALAIPAAIVLAKESDWSLFRGLVKEYILIFTGAGAHLAINAIKASRAQKRPGFQAINDWVLWLHVREVKVFWGFAYVWLGCVLLAMTVGTSDMKMYSAFFAGYSIDSIVEVFLGRFESIAKTSAKTLTDAATTI